MRPSARKATEDELRPLAKTAKNATDPNPSRICKMSSTTSRPVGWDLLARFTVDSQSAKELLVTNRPNVPAVGDAPTFVRGGSC